MIFTRRCADCGGSGTIGRKACSRCQGEGRVMQSEWMEVRIPAGVDRGSRVRLPGGGNAGRRGAPAGDFILDVEVEPHPFYRREGADLHCEIPITIVEAALGAHVEVPTLEGGVSIEIPAGTQAGQRFRLRKRGMPRPGEASRGDLFVSVRVWVPTVSDEASRGLLQEFARRHHEDPRKAVPTGKPAAVKG
jgi:molecular chaperone DnaJ